MNMLENCTMTEEIKAIWAQFEASGVFGWMLSGLLWFLGGWDESILALVMLLAADFILGTGRAIQEHRYDGDVFRRRLLRKTVPTLIVIFLAHMVDLIFSGHIPFFQHPFRSMVMGFVGVTEFLSANRNMNALFGVRLIPASIIEKLEAYKSGGES